MEFQDSVISLYADLIVISLIMWVIYSAFNNDRGGYS